HYPPPRYLRQLPRADSPAWRADQLPALRCLAALVLGPAHHDRAHAEDGPMSDVYGAIIAAELAEASREGRRGRGKAEATRKLIAACREILDEIQPATVRAVCYRLFTAGLIPDMGKASTDKVSRQ